MVRILAALVLASAATLSAGLARADDDTPSPPARALDLPVLIHPDVEARTSTLMGSLSDPATGRAVALVIQRFALEVPVLRPWLHVGAAWAVAGAVPPRSEGARKLLGGNVETHARAVWTSPIDGLSLGGAVGVLLPTARHHSTETESIALAASSANVADYNLFRRMTLGLVSSVDARVTTGAVSFQARHGLEYAIDPVTFQASTASTVSSLYVGVALGDAVIVGGEISELYLLDAKIADGRRAHLVAQAGASWSLGAVVPELVLFSTVGTPVSTEIESVVGAQLGVTWIWSRAR